MSTFALGLPEARATLPLTNFSPDWTVLARKSGYRRLELARLLNVSVRTLDRYFQQHLSLSACQSLSELQLTDAYHLVLAGKPLKEISYHVGFKQPSHFSRRFKARFGLPPSLFARTSSNLIPLLSDPTWQMAFSPAPAPHQGELPTAAHSQNFMF